MRSQPPARQSPAKRVQKRWKKSKNKKATSNNDTSSIVGRTVSVQVRLQTALQSPRIKREPQTPRRTMASPASTARTLRSSKHGRQRRAQRGIDKRELHLALKRGTRTRLRRNVAKYQYNGISFIYDELARREITSYVDVLDLPYRTISREDLQAHQDAQVFLRDHPDRIRSHTVMLIDTSGSMRQSDVQGARSRLSAVFLSIARDFVEQRIQSGVATKEDAISVIQMGEKPKLICSHLPTDYKTYNWFLALYKLGTLPAGGHCCYQPSLQMAAELLKPVQQVPNCQQCVMVLTDGRPSDAYIQRVSWDKATVAITDIVSDLASRLGHRLTVQAIGMGQSFDQFATLQRMVATANEHGSTGQLQLPSLSSSGLGMALSNVASQVSSMNSSLASGHNLGQIRMVTRESKQQVEQTLFTEAVSRKDFEIHMNVIGFIHRQVYDTNTSQFVEASLIHPLAKGVAVRHKPFGEGTERFAFQCFEVAADGTTVVGDALVAKQARLEFVDEGKFARAFCRLQARAQTLASLFQERLDAIPILDEDTPKIEFIPCSIYTLTKYDEATGIEATSTMVVEPRLYGHFEKWNSNNGWIRTRSPHRPDRVPSNRVTIKQEPGLGTIQEEEASPDAVMSGPSSGSGSDPSTNSNPVIGLTLDEDPATLGLGPDEKLFVSKNDVAQAFSHFSYVASGRSLLVCDLQGTYDGGYLRFTDPVIHSCGTNRVYGKTDRGEKGIDDFLNSHKCNALCSLVTTGFFPCRSFQVFSPDKSTELGVL